MENLADLPQVEFCSDVTSIVQCSVDILFCLEVFEHLPAMETENALQQIERVMNSDGKVIIGVPVEIGFPALYKGGFSYGSAVW
jgi:predicted SAM-dependent methyltransferase